MGYGVEQTVMRRLLQLGFLIALFDEPSNTGESVKVPIVDFDARKGKPETDD